MKLNAVLALAGLLSTLPLAAHAEDLVAGAADLSAVPAEVMKSASRTLPGVTFVEAEINVELGTAPSLVIWEITGLKDGEFIEVDVRADGSIDEIETVIELAAVPKLVLETLKSEFPGYTTSKIERSVRPRRDGGRVVWYEFKGANSEKALLDVEITEDGRYYIMEAD